MGVKYATREDVKNALDIAATARSNAQVDRAVETASRSVEGLLKRHFYPLTATRHFDWPDRRRSRAWRLWLDGDEVISVDTLKVAGTEIPASDYWLEPHNDGPPFNRIEMKLGGGSAFAGGDNAHQRAIQVDGLFGYTADEKEVGELTGDLGDTDSATASVSWSDPKVGVGDILRINSERMVVTGRTMVNSGQDLQSDLDAQASDVTASVADGTAFATDQVILIDAERMLVTDIADNNLVVKRAWDGSVLAAHSSGADVFTLTGVQLDRAQLGTDLASHSSGAAIRRHDVPGLVRDLTIGEAIDQLQQEQAGYGRTAGQGESERELGGRGLRDLRKEAVARYGRKARTGAI